MYYSEDYISKFGNQTGFIIDLLLGPTRGVQYKMESCQS